MFLKHVKATPRRDKFDAELMGAGEQKVIAIPSFGGTSGQAPLDNDPVRRKGPTKNLGHIETSYAELGSKRCVFAQYNIES